MKADIQIKFDKGEEGKLKKLIEKLGKSKTNQALRMAINEGVKSGRVEVKKGIQEKYNIGSGRLNDRKKGLNVKLANNKDLSANIHGFNVPISLSNFNPQYRGKRIANKLKKDKHGNLKKGGVVRRSTSAITVEVVKGERKELSTAFIPGVVAHKDSGPVVTPAIFARGQKQKIGFGFSKSRYPIDTLTSVSVGTMARNVDVRDKYKDRVQNVAQRRFLYHVQRLINDSVKEN